MNELMWREIDAQPAYFRECLPRLRAAAASLRLSGGRVIMAGCGDSYFSALAVGEVFSRQLIPFKAVTSQELAYFFPVEPKDLVVLASISGSTARSVQACKRAREAGAHTVAITCNGNSLLAQLCDEVLLLPYHPLSRDTPHTLDYLLTLLAQTAIAERLAGSTFNELDSVPELLSETINVASQQVDHCANLVNEMSLLLFLGAGADLGTCMYGAAKFHEADGLRACHGEIENFWHGMHLIVGQQDCITVLSSRVEPPQTEQFLVSTLQQLTPNVLYIGSREINVPHTIFLPVSDTVVRPFITAITPQLLCHAVACRLGIDVDAPASARPKSHNYHAQAAWFEHLDYAASRFVD